MSRARSDNSKKSNNKPMKSIKLGDNTLQYILEKEKTKNQQGKTVRGVKAIIDPTHIKYFHKNSANNDYQQLEHILKILGRIMLKEDYWQEKAPKIIIPQEYQNQENQAKIKGIKGYFHKDRKESNKKNDLIIRVTNKYKNLFKTEKETPAGDGLERIIAYQEGKKAGEYTVELREDKAIIKELRIGYDSEITNNKGKEIKPSIRAEHLIYDAIKRYMKNENKNRGQQPITKIIISNSINYDPKLIKKALAKEGIKGVVFLEESSERKKQAGYEKMTNHELKRTNTRRSPQGYVPLTTHNTFYNKK